jgi:hypothetical protein
VLPRLAKQITYGSIPMLEWAERLRLRCDSSHIGQPLAFLLRGPENTHGPRRIRRGRRTAALRLAGSA